MPSGYWTSSEVLQSLYDKFVEYANEDGYAVCSIAFAGKQSGVGVANVLGLTQRLEDMGFIRIYESTRDSSVFRIVKIIGPYDEDAYRLYVFNKVTSKSG